MSPAAPCHEISPTSRRALWGYQSAREPPLGLLVVATMPVDRAVGEVLVIVSLVLFEAALLLAYLMPRAVFPRWLQDEIATGTTPGLVYDGWVAAFAWLFGGIVGVGFILFVFLVTSKLAANLAMRLPFEPFAIVDL